jgi:hypothetical protein
LIYTKKWYILNMAWIVGFTGRAAKQAGALSPALRAKLAALIKQIQVEGPVRGDWPNYSKLSDGEYHCHLSHRYVVCWRVIGSEIHLVEIYYAGSRENAPY